VKSYGRRALSAAIVVFVCAAIAAACNSSSPVDIDSPAGAPATSALTSGFSVSPRTLDFGTTQTRVELTLRNDGNRRVLWKATERVGWLSLDSTSGRVPAGSTRRIVVTVDRSGRSPGTYRGRIRLDAGNAGSTRISVSMTVPSSQSDPTDPTDPIDPTLMLAGQLVDQFDGHALAGLTVEYNGRSTTTDGSGRFSIPGSPVSSWQQLTLSGSGVYKRVTFAKTGDSRWQVVPSSFNMGAFNDVARDEWGPSTVRWTTAPTVYIDSRAEGFSSPDLQTWIAEVRVQAADFVSQWSGTKIQPASVIVTSNPPNDLSAGTIVIHFSESSSRYAGSSAMIGYSRLSYGTGGTINGSAIWLRYLRYADRPGKRKGILGHEMGHAMGYGHMSSDEPSFMEPSIGTKTELLAFDVKAASLLYTRTPRNSSPDTDSSSGMLGSLAPSGLPAAMEWICEAGE
jgi:hypothetical protein